MRKITFYFVALVCMVLTEANAQSFTVVDSFPTPSYIPMGLEWINGYLWHSDRYSHLIYKIDPTTHAIIRSFSPNIIDPTGLAWDGSHLFCADWSYGKIYRIDTTSGAALDSFPSPNQYPVGLTWDGNHLWCNEVLAGRLYELDTTGSVIKYFEYPFWLTGLTFDGVQFWVTGQQPEVNGINRFYRISTSGDTLASYQPPGRFPLDLAWDGSYLWSCDSYSKKFYKIGFTPTGIEHNTSTLPLGYSLEQNYPNPFNLSTTIQFAIPQSTYVQLNIFNLLGEQVATLASEKLEAGVYTRQWNPRNLSNGVYFYQFKAGNYIETKKLIVRR
jgi:hypothetical protein